MAVLISYLLLGQIYLLRLHLAKSTLDGNFLSPAIANNISLIEDLDQFVITMARDRATIANSSCTGGNNICEARRGSDVGMTGFAGKHWLTKRAEGICANVEGVRHCLSCIELELQLRVYIAVWN